MRSGPSELLARIWRWLIPPVPARERVDEGENIDAAEDVHVVPIEEQIDLHHFAPRDIASVVDEYLREARARGFHEVRIIHGRGKGVQRQRVQKQLARHPFVESYRSDGTGSTLATLRHSVAKRRNNKQE